MGQLCGLSLVTSFAWESCLFPWCIVHLLRRKLQLDRVDPLTIELSTAIMQRNFLGMFQSNPAGQEPPAKAPADIDADTRGELTNESTKAAQHGEAAESYNDDSFPNPQADADEEEPDQDFRAVLGRRVGTHYY
jgi:hypothetical protein